MDYDPPTPQSLALRDSLKALLHARVDDRLQRPAARAISFSQAMARALLEGRKSETRRVVRPQTAVLPDAGACPHARPGETLWVREPFAEIPEGFAYAADDNAGNGQRFRPAMYMPRRASRLKLRVTAVTAERLHAITDDAVKREGCPTQILIARAWFSTLWDGLHGERGERWGDNPWVWVIAFALERDA